MDFKQNWFCCGVNEFGNFSSSGWQLPPKRNSASGAGLYIATFINTESCRRAYENLNSRYKLLYQSPLRYNKYSGRQLFLCIFSDKDKI